LRKKQTNSPKRPKKEISGSFATNARTARRLRDVRLLKQIANRASRHNVAVGARRFIRILYRLFPESEFGDSAGSR
jgi:hypothetical protein